MIKSIIHDEEGEVFYLLANKYNEKLGFYLLKIEDNDPNKYDFVMKWENKLDIGDVDIYINRVIKEQGEERYKKIFKFKELLISYKTIYMNTYTLQVFDISDSDQDGLADNWTVFKHESFQLWEQKVCGIFLKNNKDFVTMNSQGIQVMTLSERDTR